MFIYIIIINIILLLLYYYYYYYCYYYYCYYYCYYYYYLHYITSIFITIVQYNIIYLKYYLINNYFLLTAFEVLASSREECTAWIQDIRAQMHTSKMNRNLNIKSNSKGNLLMENKEICYWQQQDKHVIWKRWSTRSDSIFNNHIVSVDDLVTETLTQDSSNSDNNCIEEGDEEEDEDEDDEQEEEEESTLGNQARDHIHPANISPSGNNLMPTALAALYAGLGLGSSTASTSASAGSTPTSSNGSNSKPPASPKLPPSKGTTISSTSSTAQLVTSKSTAPITQRDSASPSNSDPNNKSTSVTLSVPAPPTTKPPIIGNNDATVASTVTNIASVTGIILLLCSVTVFIYSASKEECKYTLMH